MQLPKLWKIGAGATFVGVVALVATACAGTTTVTAPPQTVTASATDDDCCPEGANPAIGCSYRRGRC